MTCTCVDVEFGSYDAAVEVSSPPHLVSSGCYTIRDTICIDLCILPEVQLLWKAGIRTTGSCCGHGKITGTITTVDDDWPAMDAMGYQRHEGHPHVFQSQTCVLAGE